MDYKERIRALREDNDYTQSRIAGLLNIGQNTYADYELGKTRIPVDSLIKLAQFYNVDMNYITDIRLKCSLELLSDESGDGEPVSLDDVARDSGFGSYSSFWRAFQKKFSMTPSEYRSLHDKNA